MSNTIEFKFTREEPLRFLSHLDQQRVFQRALRRAEIPVAYSQGFNPHPILTFALAMPVGMTSLEEYGRVGLTEEMSPECFISKLNEQLPVGLNIISAKKLEGKTTSLTASITDCLYRIEGKLKLNLGSDTLTEKIDAILKNDSLVVLKRNKKGKMIEKEIRTFIKTIRATEPGDNRFIMEMRLAYQSQESVKPELVLEGMNNRWNSEIFDLDLGLKIKRLEMNLKKI